MKRERFDGAWLLVQILSSPHMLDGGVLLFLTCRDLLRCRATCTEAYCRLEKLNLRNVKGTRNSSLELPWPGLPGLFRTADAVAAGDGIYAHQLVSLKLLRCAESRESGGRGGIYADDAGLGKTVTVLALVASTAGQRPLPLVQCPLDVEAWDMLTRDAIEMRKALLSGPFKGVQDYRSLLDPSHVDYKRVRELLETVREDDDENGASWRSPEALERHCASLVSKMAAPRRSRALMLNELGHGFAKLRVKLSITAGLNEKQRRRHALDGELRTSHATLVVVPDPLLEHWVQTLKRHLNPAYFADAIGDGNGRGVVFVHGYGDLSDLTLPLTSMAHVTPHLPNTAMLSTYLVVVTTFMQLVEQSKIAQLGSVTEKRSNFARSPLLEIRFLRLIIDEGNLLLNGSPPEEKREKRRRRRKKKKPAPHHSSGASGMAAAAAVPPPLPEPHLKTADELAAEEQRRTERRAAQALMEARDFLTILEAERRWVMTATPTTGASGDLRDNIARQHLRRDLAQLQLLFRFLLHPRYGLLDPSGWAGEASSSAAAPTAAPPTHASAATCRRRSTRRRSAVPTEESSAVSQLLQRYTRSIPAAAMAAQCWASEIADPLVGGAAAARARARARLVALLRTSLVRHSKRVLALPPPVFRDSEVAVRRARGDDEEAFQARVDSAQAKHIMETMAEAEAAAAGGGRAAWGDRPVKAIVYSSSRADLLSVAEYFYAEPSFGRGGVAEMTESAGRRRGPAARSYNALELQRFRNDRRRYRACPLCGAECEDASNAACCSRTLLEVILDEALPPGAPVGAAHPLARHLTPPEMTELQRRVGGDLRRRVLVEAERLVTSVDWEARAQRAYSDHYLRLPALVASGSSRGALVEAALSRGIVGTRVAVRIGAGGALRGRRSLAQWSEWGAEDCARRAAKDRYTGQDWFLGPLPAASGGDVATGVIAKFGRCARFHRRAWYQGPTLGSQPWREEKTRTRVLFLQHEGSHGLDLSFVTHIFLLERISDAALLQQIVARAHRLGAKGAVLVETVHTFVDEADHDEPPPPERALGVECGSSSCEFTAPLVSGEGPREPGGSPGGVPPGGSVRYYCEHCYLPNDSREEAEEHERSCIMNAGRSAESTAS